MKLIQNLFSSCLNQLRQEIVLFNDEGNIWKTFGNVRNPAGTLSLHICGNLMHNIGTVLGNLDYVRNRNAEFMLKVPTEKILEEIDATKEKIIQVLEKITTEQLTSIFPDNSHGEDATVFSVLMKIAMHASYHTGQINYLRRVLEK